MPNEVISITELGSEGRTILGHTMLFECTEICRCFAEPSS